ncbi:MAG: PD40 domain-containing protein, partial [Bacteroidales bacterium]|nr:PD40 domain-containing protein [Bacteroidales bacterium]
MKRLSLSAAIILATFMTASAAINPLWLRKNSISPDGSRIAFCYQGDIFTVSTDGGEARRITSNPAYDTDPLWTPDGQSIVFSSYREKSKDIYIISCEGGTPERLTTYPGNETPLAVLSDGSILFSANIQQDASFGEFPGNAQLYIIGRDGGRPQLVTSLPMASLSVSRNGSVLYEDIKGYEDPFRKH